MADKPQPAEERSYKLTLEGPNMRFERHVNDDQLVAILAIALGASAGQRSPASPPASSEAADRQAIGEFLDDVAVRNNPERIAAILLYLDEQHGRKPIDKREILGWFQRAGESPPKNLWRDLNKAVKRSLIAEDSQRADHFFVTTTGKRELRDSGS